MKFLNQYELLEPVTGGPVETFTARDLSSGERLIVHLFSVADLASAALTAQGALEQFSRIAPAPLGSVVAAGRYEQTSHAYLITRVPVDGSALPAWIRSYERRLQTTHAAPQPSASSKNSPPADLHSPGEFTRAFLSAATADLDLNTTPNDSWANRPAAPFTKEFLSGFEAVEAGKMAKAPPASPLEAVSFTAEFLVGRSPQAAPMTSLGARGAPEPAREESSSPSARLATGEFTSFFSGPFGSEKAAPEPMSPGDSDALPSPQRKEAGEFTRIFGPVNVPPKDSGSLAELPTRQPGSFTRRLQSPQDVQPRPELEEQPLREASPVWNKEINWDGAPESSVPQQECAATGARFGRGQKPHSDGSFLQPGSNLPEAATEVFRPMQSAQGSQAASSPPAAPSDYTRIISAQPAPPVPKGAPATPSVSSSPVASPSVTPIPPMGVPAGVAGPMPPAPQGPRLPQVSPPPLPSPTPQPAAAGKTLSYLPVIIVMNVLLMVAVALVLYFALKH